MKTKKKIFRNIIIMKITEITTVKHQITTKIRLAAYCRVSSDSADQLHSFAAQIRYYSEYTAKHWEDLLDATLKVVENNTILFDYYSKFKTKYFE